MSALTSTDKELFILISPQHWTLKKAFTRSNRGLSIIFLVLTINLLIDIGEWTTQGAFHRIFTIIQLVLFLALLIEIISGGKVTKFFNGTHYYKITLKDIVIKRPLKKAIKIKIADVSSIILAPCKIQYFLDDSKVVNMNIQIITPPDYLVLKKVINSKKEEYSFTVSG